MRRSQRLGLLDLAFTVRLVDSQAIAALFPGSMNCILRVVPPVVHNHQEVKVKICFRYNVFKISYIISCRRSRFTSNFCLLYMSFLSVLWVFRPHSYFVVVQDVIRSETCNPKYHFQVVYLPQHIIILIVVVKGQISKK